MNKISGEKLKKKTEINGFRKDSTSGKIIHKSANEKTKKTTIIAEVNDETREKQN